MESETLKLLIEHVGGPKYVLGFRFANGYKLIYSRPEHRINVDEDLIKIGNTEFLKYKHTDSYGAIAWSYLEVEEIAQMYVLDNLDRNVYLRDILE